MGSASGRCVYLCCQLSSQFQMQSLRHLHSAIWRFSKPSKCEINRTSLSLTKTNNLHRCYSHKLRLGKAEKTSGQDAAQKENTLFRRNNEKIHELMFQEMMMKRQKEASCSVLVELTSKEDGNFAAKLCRDAGKVKQFIPYSGGYGNSFLLAEFAEEDSVHQLLKNCHFRNSGDTFPLYSRLIRFERRKGSKGNSFLEDNSLNKKSIPSHIVHTCKISKLIQDLHEDVKISELSTRLRFFFASTLRDCLCGMFPYAAILPFGSSVNSFGAEGCDLDLMVQFYPENRPSKSDLYFQTKTSSEYRILQQRALGLLYEILRNVLPGINYVTRIKTARVPILKFSHTIFEMECDISANNMSAIYMSEILYFCGAIDPRVRPLVFAVKKWAKEANVTYSTPGSWITNFSLSLLVLFFLQNRPVPILPPLMKAISINCNSDTFSCFGIEYIENPLKWKELARANDESLAELLKEFLFFLSSCPFKNREIILLSGTSVPNNNGYPLSIQYPLEETLNVSKNVSESELMQLQKLAKISALQLERSLVQREEQDSNLMNILGIQHLKKDKSQQINISNLYEDNVTHNKENVRVS